jgi:hypothetical protein
MGLKMRYSWPLGIVLSIFVVVSSCSLFGVNTPTKTVNWQPDGSGYIQYCTNDQKDLGYGEYYIVPGSFQVAPTSYPAGVVKVNINKISGADSYGFDILFGFQDQNNYYRLLVTKTGKYRIDKKVAGVYSTITDWSDISLPYGVYTLGYNTVHTFQIKQEYADSYNITMDTYVTITNLFDSSLPKSGSTGFYVSIGNSLVEDFPFTSEDVRFQMTLPIVAP